MNAANIGKQDGLVSATSYRQQMQSLQNLRNGVEGVSAGFNEALVASGKYDVATVRTLSRTQTLTKAIREQKLSLGELAKNWKSIRRDVTNNQGALAAASTMSWGQHGDVGKQKLDFFMPKNLDGALNTARIKYGVINEAIRSAAQQTINWGKNTQWAGRQITVGLGVPISIAAFQMTKLALEADRAITRIQKVYDVDIDPTIHGLERQIEMEKQLDQVRTDAFNNAYNMANMYGQSLEETLQLQGDIAAMGKQGQELVDTTAEVSRIATLGELDHQQALDMTITLMSAYKQSAEDLTETFDYMNALESGTVLQTQDFADAIPRAGGALANLGVDIKEFGVLLVALKNGGVEATEGANALKSATTRLLKPTADATQRFRDMGINIEDLVADTKGDLFQTLTQLGAKMEGVNEVQRQQAIAALFGTYQFNRLNVALDGLSGGLAGTQDGYEQVTRAMEIAGMTTEQLAQTSANEMAALQNSISGRFDRAIQTMKVQLALLGEPIMAVLTPVMEFFTRLIGAFNSLPEGIKNTTMAFLGFVGIIGPVIMLGGLLGNLAGQFGKFFSGIGGLITKFKLKIAEERAAELAAEAHGNAMVKEMTETQQLTFEIERLTKAMQDLHEERMKDIRASEEAAAMAARSQAQIDYDKSFQQLQIPNGPVDNEQLALFDDSQTEKLKGVEKKTEEIKDDMEETKKSGTTLMTKLAGLAVAAGFMADMNDASNGILTNVINISMVLAAINMTGLGGAIGKLAKAGGGGLLGVFKGIGSKIGEAFKGATGRIAGATRAAGGFGAMLKGIVTNPATKLWGPVGLLAAGVGLMIQIRAQMTEAEAQQRAINESTEQWANILGYVKEAKIINEDGTETVNQLDANVEAVKKLRDGNEDLANSLRDAADAGDGFETVYNKALREALKVRMTGGSVEQARQAMEVALMAADIDQPVIDRLMIDFDKIDLADPQAIMDALKQQLQEIINELAANGGLDASWFRELFSGDVSDEGRAALSEMTSLFTQGFKSANPDERDDLMHTFADKIDDLLTSSPSFNDLMRNNADFFEELGIDTADEAYQKYQEAWQLASDSGALADGRKMKDLPQWAQDILDSDAWSGFKKEYEESMEVALTDLGKGLGKSDDQIQEWIDSGMTLTDVLESMGMSTMSAAEANKAYQQAIGSNLTNWLQYNDEQKLALLNLYRAKAGMEAATDVSQGFGDALEEVADKAKLATGALDDMYTMGIDGLDADTYVNMVKDQFSGGMNVAYQAAENIWNKMQQAEVDAIQNAGDARQKALDDRGDAEEKYWDGRADALDNALEDEKKAFDKAWDAKEKALDDEEDRLKDNADKKIDAIHAEIDALENANDVRNKLFEAEKKRIQRMAELYNAGVDFNTALNSGNLDEAAKIYSNTAASVQQYAIDDQQERLNGITDKKKSDLEKKIDAIEAERDAALDAIEARKKALKDLRDAEEEAMQDRADARKKELDAERQKAKDALEADKERQRQATEDAVANTQARWEDNKAKLDMELETIKAFTPRNQAEKDKQIAMIEAAYAKYGIKLTDYTDAWSKQINDGFFYSAQAATNRVRNDLGWEQFAASIQNRITDGIGISMEDLVYYLKNGKWPSSQAQMTPSANMAEHWGVNHTGGFAGNGAWSQKDRMGIPRSAGLYPSEIPTVLKRGEYVVNAAAARKNLALLQYINNKKRNPINEVGAGGMVDENGMPVGHTMFRHSGGIADYIDQAGTAGILAMSGVLVAKATEMGAYEAARGAYMASGGGTGYTGSLGGGINAVLAVARSMEGTPYIWGGADARGADCSGFMSIIQNAVYGKQPPYGRRWATASFSGGIEQDGWKRGGTSRDVFRIGVTPGSHTAGTFAGINVESGSGHGPMVGKNALGANSGFQYQYYLPAANNLPQLREGGSIRYDNTLANLHKGETVLTAPLTERFKQNVASGEACEYNVTIDLRGAYIKEDIDIERAVDKAIEKRENKNGRKRVIK